MRVRHLNLADFRNYVSADVALVPGVNVFVGSNGQGKTNLVESLGYLSSLGSHRVSTDQALVRHGAQSAIVRALLAHNGREILVELQINASGANRAQISRSPAKTRELPRYFSSVLFAPEDLALVRGDPGGRRRFLDGLLVLRTPRLSGVLADYDRALRQRNTLLKSARAQSMRGGSLSTLDVWDERLIALGAEIIAARLALVEALRPRVAAAYLAIAGSDHGPRLASQLSILSSDPSVDADADAGGERADDGMPVEELTARFTSALAGLRRRELERGLTLVGPHRDDLLLELNGLPAKGYASHGESWSFALSLKLASAELLRAESSAGDPVLILDDVFAELDEPRRQRLATAIVGYEQVLITAAVENDIPPELRTNLVRIRAGEVIESTIIDDVPATEPAVTDPDLPEVEAADVASIVRETPDA
ncbi:DNA replication/repair protein RecF [Naasia lichenicola]|uniref:DNA replication and repair protein RecF n=1 Tax=Naasia lichenicola TaxID=2565933 RepID=A0A4S4FGS0_9MICO|nr:DNA replication/repair protein RecF [Naasia lichenicola]THG29459.1 DNA replication/repair protein RecF [Naasia lichenicola]